MVRKYFTLRGRGKGTRTSCVAGFTLIELMVSVAIFVMVMAIVSTSYVSIVRGQRQANEIRKMYSDVRVFLDLLGEEARLGTVDYGCYNFFFNPSVEVTPPCPPYNVNVTVAGSLQQGRTTSLALARSDGERTLIFLDTTDSTLKMQKYQKINTAWSAVPGYETPRSLLSDRLRVKHISFAVFPHVNPYSDDPAIYANNAVQFQPKVTVFLSVENAEGVATPFAYDFQTTLSSRVYSRAL